MARTSTCCFNVVSVTSPKVVEPLGEFTQRLDDLLGEVNVTK
jgi:hypothetical protein